MSLFTNLVGTEVKKWKILGKIILSHKFILVLHDPTSALIATTLLPLPLDYLHPATGICAILTDSLSNLCRVLVFLFRRIIP